MNTEDARVTVSGLEDRGRGDDERGMDRARNRCLLRRSIEILLDLGLSKENIVAYYRRFPTPAPTTG
jgi:hypothetical protein